jgi:XRE family transcriptional regulator, fatty acid utilization regulator
MDQAGRRKIMAGGRMRKLRSELALSQAAMAQELGVSVSYLNLVERNQRPVTAQLLIKLSEVYAVDPRSFAQEDDQRASTELEEIFADPLFAQSPVPRAEIRDLIEQAPATGLAIRALYQAYRSLRDTEQVSLPEATGTQDPVEALREFLQAESNYFPTLEDIAEKISLECDGDGGDLFSAIVRRLQEKHGIRVQIVPAHVMPQMLRRFDMHRRKVVISELLETPGRTFQAAIHLGLLEATTAIDAIAKNVHPQNDSTARLARIMLSNYFAASLMMPYQRFLEAAEQVGYDVEILSARFSASFEQVAHRLTTLARPTARGIPFFMIRVDMAGNVSKRFSSGAFPFSKFGGTCPRWNLHHSFATPGRVQTQVLELNDGSKWFSIARTVQRVRTPYGELENQFVIGLGCDIKHAAKLVYAKSQDQPAMPIGVTCRMCDRANCSQRAAPQANRPLDINENLRGFSPFDSVLTR